MQNVERTICIMRNRSLNLQFTHSTSISFCVIIFVSNFPVFTLRRSQVFVPFLQIEIQLSISNNLNSIRLIRTTTLIINGLCLFSFPFASFNFTSIGMEGKKRGKCNTPLKFGRFFRWRKTKNGRPDTVALFHKKKPHLRRKEPERRYKSKQSEWFLGFMVEMCGFALIVLVKK